MIKEAYDAGVQQALFDMGLTKIAADPGMLTKAWKAIKGSPAMQYGLAGLGGAGLGAGVGALAADDSGSGALRGAGIGLLGGLGARGGMHLKDYLSRKGLEAAGAAEPNLLQRGLTHLHNQSQWHPNVANALGLGLGGAAGLGAGAGINALMD